jgi:hypothetical protein
LDLFVRIGTFQGVTRNPNRKNPSLPRALCEASQAPSIPSFLLSQPPARPGRPSRSGYRKYGAPSFGICQQNAFQLEAEARPILRRESTLSGRTGPHPWTGRLAESGPYAPDSAQRNQLILSSIRGADFLKYQTARGARTSRRGFESRVVRCLGVLVDHPLFCDEGHSGYRICAIL